MDLPGKPVNEVFGRIGAAIARFFRGMGNTMRRMWMGKENVEMAVDELEAVAR